MVLLAWVVSIGFVLGMVGFFLALFNNNWITNNFSWGELGALLLVIGIISWIACIPLWTILSATGNL